jgi:hypothetical protein
MNGRILEFKRGATNAANTFDLNPGVAEGAYEVHRKIVAKHGIDPCTRSQAAAHEAGHCVLLRSLGAGVESVEIKRRTAMGRSLQVWLGLTVPAPSSWARGVTNTDGSFQAVLQPTEFLVRSMLNNLAGVAGEYIAGKHHMSSSPDEITVAQMLGLNLDQRYGLRTGESALLGFAVVIKILQSNKAAHAELSAQIHSHKRLGGRVVAALLCDVQQHQNATSLFEAKLAAFGGASNLFKSERGGI